MKYVLTFLLVVGGLGVGCSSKEAQQEPAMATESSYVAQPSSESATASSVDTAPQKTGKTKKAKKEYRMEDYEK